MHISYSLLISPVSLCLCVSLCLSPSPLLLLLCSLASADVLASEDEQKEEEEGEDEEEGDDSEQSLDEIQSDGYQSDLMGDAADRAYINSLTAIEREQIMYERGENRRKIEERRAAQHELRELREHKKRSSNRKSKRKPSEGKLSKSRRVGDKRTASDALADLLARKTSKSKISDAYTYEDEEIGDEAYDSDLEDAGAARRRRSKQRKQQRKYEQQQEDFEGADMDEEFDQQQDKEQPSQPIDYAHLKQLVIRRVAFERMLDEPYFNELIKEMFVKVTVGTRPDDHSVAYRLCQIAGTQEWKSKYKFGQSDTKAGLLLRFGKSERVFPLSAVSNQSVTEEEFERWQKQMEADGLPLPSQEESLQRRQQCELMRRNYTYTSVSQGEQQRQMAEQ